ncbi:hypothetical protein VitviT2T_003635 [Vitis vinifera]|uniref:YlmG-like protein 1-2, chloroplastic n=2 Tax=Vitis vinifera TaxID=29760 RepID=D7SXS1_VITVI|eukprot:XP_002263900.1 PREDICTED: ylmG homolog protein 1-2, chloroplastic [Vitis vinifera]
MASQSLRLRLPTTNPTSSSPPIPSFHVSLPTLPPPPRPRRRLSLSPSTSSAVVEISRLFLTKLQQNFLPNAEEVAAIKSLRDTAVCAAAPLFFAAMRDRPRGYLNTPLTVVAAGMAKWLDIYSGVLMVRVMLSWFPNIPWERQPLSAIRDLCDPYLNLFRNIIPPVFDALDLSPLLAFSVLGVLGSILNNSMGMY